MVKSLDVPGIVFDWIKDWLQDGEQRVVLLGVVLNGLKLQVWYHKVVL